MMTKVLYMSETKAPTFFCILLFCFFFILAFQIFLSLKVKSSNNYDGKNKDKVVVLMFNCVENVWVRG